MSDLKLVFVNFIGNNSYGQYEYEFLFSETPDLVWGANWDIQCPSIFHELKPKEDTYSLIKRLTTTTELFCAQQNSCYSMQDCVDGCIALMWFYNRNGDAIVFPFGDDMDVVTDKLINNSVGYLE